MFFLSYWSIAYSLFLIEFYYFPRQKLTEFYTYAKSIYNDVKHQKIFTIRKILVVFYILKYGEFITYY